MPLSERIRRLGKTALIGAFGFVVFAVVFYLSLPYGRFKDMLASRLASAGYELEAKHVGPSLGLGMTLEEVTLVSQSAGAAKPTRILIDKATLGWSLLSYLFGGRTYRMSAEVFGGEIDGRVKTDKSDASVRASVREIDLHEIPWLKAAINLPAAGKLTVELDLDLPKQRPSEAKGQLEWSCSGCAVGDGKAKLVVASNPLLAEGLGLPRIRLGDLTGKVVMDKGVGRLHGLEIKSQDLEATVEGEIHLAQPFGTSRVDLYVRFKLSDSLLRSSEKLRTIMELAAMMGKRPDGFLGFRATGTLQSMGSVQWLKTSPFTPVAALPKPGLPAKPAPVVAAPVPPPPAHPAPPPTPPAPLPPPPPPAPPAVPVVPPIPAASPPPAAPPAPPPAPPPPAAAPPPVPPPAVPPAAAPPATAPAAPPGAPGIAPAVVPGAPGTAPAARAGGATGTAPAAPVPATP
jgi:type II secretion system protein N